MMEWVKLGDVCEIISGTTPSTNNPEYWNGDIKWITPAEIDDNTKYVTDTARKITQRGFHSASLKLLPKNTVLLSSRAPIGKVAIAATEMCCNQGFKNFVCEDGLYHEYLYYYLKSKTDYLNSLGRGATFKEISKAIVEQIKIPLLPIKNQIRIAETLDKVKGIIDARKKQLEKLDEYIKSVFYTMFGDPVTNPMSWEIVKIADLALNIQYGTSKKAFDQKLQYPILRMKNITYEGNWDFTDLKYIDLSSKEEEKYLVSKGEMLFNRTNSRELVGKTAVYRLDSPMAYAGYLIKLTPNENANCEYISAFLNSKCGKTLLLSMAKNIIGMANINAKEMGNIKIPLPPLDLQNQFAEIVEKIEAQKELLNKSLSKMETLFDCLMDQYFS